MPRIPGVPTSGANLLTKLIYRFSQRRYGAVLDPLTVIAHHRRLMMAAAVSELAVEKTATRLPANLRELAVYRVATKIGCSWCVDFGTMLQRNEGLDIDRLQHIDDYRTSDAYTEVERLVIAYADAMTEQPVQVTDEQVVELDRRLGHEGLVELTHMIAVENQRTRFNHALGLTAQGFTSGEACKVPQR
ncbi:carboxymuconolactone decarboxylase family protein [Saccharopolyspora rhizosphaerae]|uniref:Carboxymuconolactone decarboxylase family protein n=1 Tax=Saccharopolyspora rhizosphaerae TaxID=2492662 RepID=A0A3R8P4B8_9PSEU|nr:carboxymuconolactone decarboxylase family protein [Saccharopolyspora rhizosphaerae]RRO19273.1 carboxymuconolactone decarboxylase family protein [Saccharopolyspora rhizosphaerae]